MIPLEQLSVYLPYGLTCYGASDIWTLTGLTQKKVIITNGIHHQTLDIDDFNVDYSILLRPLSQLTKEIEIDGEKFVPIKKLNELNIDPNCDPVVLNDGTINYDTLKEYQLLFKWHFDVYGLIDKGLAEPIK